MARRAMVVGIDEYGSESLEGAANDAKDVAKLLQWNDARTSSGKPRENYALSDRYTIIMPKGVDDGRATRYELRRALRSFFMEDSKGDDLCFYYAGHGAKTPWGPELVTQDYQTAQYGVSMGDLLFLANNCPARSVVLILDCCFSGALGNSAEHQAMQVEELFRVEKALLREEVSIIAASGAHEKASESKARRGGVFTGALLVGLRGGAANVFGEVTVPSLFAFVSGAFADVGQRPVYKAHSKEVLVLRKVRPELERGTVWRLLEYFPSKDASYQFKEPKDQWDDGGQFKPTGERTPGQGIYYDFRSYRDAKLLDWKGKAEGKALWNVLNENEDGIPRKPDELSACIWLSITGQQCWDRLERE